MGEQEEQTQESQSPTEVGNDDISASAEEALGVATEVVPEQTIETAEQLDHKERSKLGRRISSFEQEIDGLKQTIAQLNANLIQRPDTYTQRAVDVVEDMPPVEYISTPDDLEKYEAWRAAKVERQRNTYANSYIHNVKTLSYVNPDLHAEIENELFTNVNAYPTYSNFANPAGDAQQNYLKAENKILKQRLVSSQAPKPNVRGGSPAQTGVSATTRMNTVAKSTVKLDDYAAKFIKSLGESEDADWVQKSVARS